METRYVYLDNNATTPLHPEVKEIIKKSLDLYGNASSFHELGRLARIEIEKSRHIIADFINAQPDEIIFTSCGSESNNTVLKNFTCCSNKCCSINKKNHIITSSIEHPAILQTCRCLQGGGSEVTFLPVDSKGFINLDNLKKSITSKTALVSIMHGNNEIGTIQPIKKITEIAKEKNVLVHTDAVQSIGKIKIDVKELNLDFLSLSGHKIYAPKGVGVLYAKKNTSLCPLIYGGHHEFNKRAGTENTIGIIALGKAVELLSKNMDKENKKIKQLKEKLKQGIIKNIPDININSPEKDCLTGTLNISFKYVEGESILLYLDLEGIYVSTGSACASGTNEPSHVLKAINLPDELAFNSIRFSIGRENTEKDIDYTLEKLIPIITRLRKMSPLVKR